MSTAIKVENLSKAYQLGTIGTGTLSRDLERWIARVRGKEDPFLTIGEANDRSVKGTSDVVLSLNNINFDIQQGDAVGIIGRNGAGKSTLLKLLSRVTSPTSGSIKVKGRIASLLEVGTGFHPELTGRENIFLNGAILGMRKKEIARKFDQIVDFSGVERYIDTPVKRYSSGMYVRLAFAVAAHLESEILIVDEVLAVGDLEFQQKCLGKMGDVSKSEGRTVLFVSHNISAVTTLCTKGILLDKGRISISGPVNNVISKYLEHKKTKHNYNYKRDEFVGDNSVKLLAMKIVTVDAEEAKAVLVTDKIGIEVEYEILNSHNKPEPTLALKNSEELVILHVISNLKDYTSGRKKIVFWFPSNFLNDMEYVAMVGITSSNPVIIHLEHEISFTVLDNLNAPTRGDYMDKMHGFIRPIIEIQKLF
jgi:lipopolysaccharide transport system ATP-binding protein